MKSLSILCILLIFSLNAFSGEMVLDTVPATVASNATGNATRSNVVNQVTLAANTTTETKVTAVTTNFVVPLMRFHFTNLNNTHDGSIGHVALFNSVGFGVNIVGGRLYETTDNTGTIINTELKNTLGLQVGILFASSTGAGNTTNVFAPTIGINVLNLNISWGYELGTIQDSEHRTFISAAYGIPISKIVNGGMWIWKKSNPYFGKSSF